MSRIHLLPDDVASQVAAGEVVERPASVVKELVENSLDAQARRIEVMIRRGGKSHIRVVDDGIGMDRDDALLSLERHATSKIRTGQDLAAIRTLGFRGEALPSIASVSRFRLATREHTSLAGTEITIAGGRIEAVRDGGDAPGTQIDVRSLFYNLPARRKFLRAERTETSHVEHHVQLQALGHPEVAFTLLIDDRVAVQLPPADSLITRIRDLSGAAAAEELLPIPDAARDEIRVHGFIGKPGVSRSSRGQQVIFLNGRAIENSTLNFALREGYHTALMKGQYPVTFLFLEMDPALVDVNVHPSKREVRFRDHSWQVQFRPAPPEPFAAPSAQTELIQPAAAHTLRQDWWSPPVSASAPPEAPKVTPEKSSDFRVLGVLGKLYVLMENEGGLVLVDQHAAHERILFEELRRQMEAKGVPSQRLLLPFTLQVTPRDGEVLHRNLETLQKMGVGVEPFGTDTFKVDYLPQFVRVSDPNAFLRDVIDELRETSSRSSALRLGEDVIATTVCRHAVKANDVLREPEVVRLIQDLLACELPYCCPHGRPTMIQISYAELEKKFGRQQW